MLKFAKEPDTLDNPTNEGTRHEPTTQEPTTNRAGHPHYISWAATHSKTD
jgi:hypothetical protein